MPLLEVYLSGTNYGGVFLFKMCVNTLMMAASCLLWYFFILKYRTNASTDCGTKLESTYTRVRWFLVAENLLPLVALPLARA